MLRADVSQNDCKQAVSAPQGTENSNGMRTSVITGRRRAELGAGSLQQLTCAVSLAGELLLQLLRLKLESSPLHVGLGYLMQMPAGAAHGYEE